jgi:YMGG-like Gly-zipper
LRSPETIAIEQRGRHFTIASSRGRQIAFDATGRPRTETSIGGRPVQVNALLNRDQLVISSTGDRGRDYHVTFDASNRGEQLRVTRRIYVDRLTQPVIVNSTYDRASDVAELDLYRGGWSYEGPNDRSDNYFIIPHGTRLVGVLNQELDTETAREGDSISLVIRSPREYENATLEGTITNVERSGRISGRAEMSFDFDRIRTPNGRTYPFAGYVESIRAPGEEDIQIDNEGSIREEDSQTRRTVTRTGIGGAIGALIGAIAGGGKGAAIGAAVGAGTGAGSVFVQGRDDLGLKSGTEITIRTVRPRDAEARR